MNQENSHSHGSPVTQLTTFFVGDSWMGLDISVIQEINRNMVLTAVPHAPECVKGVMNLRGEVVTVLDIRVLLGLPTAEPTTSSRNVIVKCDGELVGMWVDRVADIISVRPIDLSPTPSNLHGPQSRFVRSVFQTSHGLVLIVDPKELFAASLAGTNMA